MKAIPWHAGASVWLLLVCPGSVQAQLAPTDWPMVGHDARQTGQGPSTTNRIDTPELKWAVQTGGELGGPAIGFDGTVYFGSVDHNLYAVRPDGRLLWTFEADDYVINSPAIAANGLIYFSVRGGWLYAVGPRGELRWRFRAGGDTTSPAVAEDGTVYIGAVDGFLYAVRPTGVRKWRFRADNGIMSDPSIAPDGTIHFLDSGSNVYAVNPDGTLKWKYDTDGWAWFGYSCVVATNGTVYVAGGRVDVDSESAIYAIGPDGNLAWKGPVGVDAGPADESPRLGADGTIYFVGGLGLLYAINPDGAEKWRLRDDISTGSPGFKKIVAAGDGRLYGTTIDGELCAISSDGVLLWWVGFGLAPTTELVVSRDAQVYFGLNGGKMVAFGELGVPPKLEGVPESLDWGNVKVNRVKRKLIKITNTGAGALEIYEIHVLHTNVFGFVGAFPRVIPPGRSLRLPLSFRPPNTGPAEAWLTFDTNDPSNRYPLVTLSGTGIVSRVRQR